jgi:hypothetical protein
MNTLITTIILIIYLILLYFYLFYNHSTVESYDLSAAFIDLATYN